MIHRLSMVSGVILFLWAAAAWRRCADYWFCDFPFFVLFLKMLDHGSLDVGSCPQSPSSRISPSSSSLRCSPHDDTLASPIYQHQHLRITTRYSSCSSSAIVPHLHDLITSRDPIQEHLSVCLSCLPYNLHA